jgi:hypothetical protein
MRPRHHDSIYTSSQFVIILDRHSARQRKNLRRRDTTRTMRPGNWRRRGWLPQLGSDGTYPITGCSQRDVKSSVLSAHAMPCKQPPAGIVGSCVHRAIDFCIEIIRVEDAGYSHHGRASVQMLILPPQQQRFMPIKRRQYAYQFLNRHAIKPLFQRGSVATFDFTVISVYDRQRTIPQPQRTCLE